MTSIPMTPPAITLGNRVLELRGLRMKHVRAGLLEQMQLVSTELASAKQRNTKEVIEAQITIVYAAVDDQIERKEFDALLDDLSPLAGTEAIAGAIPAILLLSGFALGAPGKKGEDHSPASPTSPGSTA